MVWALLKRWRNARARQLVVFVPVKNREPYDGVAALKPAVIAALGRGFRYWIHIDKHWQHLGEALIAQQIIDKPRNVIVFAHPSRDRLGFAVNGPDLSAEAVLPVAWWCNDHNATEFLFAHVCFGLQVLERPVWAERFPKWVSYRAEVEAYVGSDKAMRRWTRLSEAIVEACAKGKSPTRAKERVWRAYLQELDDIEDNYDPANGDDAMRMCLQAAMTALISSEDLK